VAFQMLVCTTMNEETSIALSLLLGLSAAVMLLQMPLFASLQLQCRIFCILE
jgi:hypothetical protein